MMRRQTQTNAKTNRGGTCLQSSGFSLPSSVFHSSVVRPLGLGGVHVSAKENYKLQTTNYGMEMTCRAEPGPLSGQPHRPHGALLLLPRCRRSTCRLMRFESLVLLQGEYIAHTTMPVRSPFLPLPLPPARLHSAHCSRTTRCIIVDKHLSFMTGALNEK